MNLAGLQKPAPALSALLAQFHPLEDAARRQGVVVWPMVEFEADDAPAAAHRAARIKRVDKVCI
jgi:hypothetical protein